MNLFVDVSAFCGVDQVSSFCVALRRSLEIGFHLGHPGSNISLFVSSYKADEDHGWKPLLSGDVQLHEKNRKLILTQVDRLEEHLKATWPTPSGGPDYHWIAQLKTSSKTVLVAAKGRASRSLGESVQVLKLWDESSTDEAGLIHLSDPADIYAHLLTLMDPFPVEEIAISLPPSGLSGDRNELVFSVSKRGVNPGELRLDATLALAGLTVQIDKRKRLDFPTVFNVSSLVKASGLCQSLLCGYPIVCCSQNVSANKKRCQFLVKFLLREDLCLVLESPTCSPCVGFPTEDLHLILVTMMTSDLMNREASGQTEDEEENFEDIEIDMSTSLGKLTVNTCLSPGQLESSKPLKRRESKKGQSKEKTKPKKVISKRPKLQPVLDISF